MLNTLCMPGECVYFHDSECSGADPDPVRTDFCQSSDDLTAQGMLSGAIIFFNDSGRIGALDDINSLAVRADPNSAPAVLEQCSHRCWPLRGEGNLEEVVRPHIEAGKTCGSSYPDFAVVVTQQCQHVVIQWTAGGTCIQGHVSNGARSRIEMIEAPQGRDP
jgi:hypothetical protein